MQGRKKIKNGTHGENETLVLLLCVSFILFVAVYPAFAAEDSVVITQSVTGAVCGNGTCESGEDSSNCSADCPAAAEKVSVPALPSGIFDIFPPQIIEIKIQPQITSAVIFWKTSEPALSQVFFGKTLEYREGIISEISFAQEHSAILTDLLPDTVYHFQIEVRDSKGNKARSGDRTIRTLPLPSADITPPANVSNFEAVAGDQRILITWKNPPDKDFTGVRIQRSTFFYPQDPFDGEMVYNEKGEQFLDTTVQRGVRYYYTAFAYDKSGNYASGAVVSAVVGLPSRPPEVSLPSEEVLPPELQKLRLSDFDFWQEGKKVPVEEGRRVRVNIGIPLTVSIDYEKVPEVLKTILITLEQSGEKASEARNLQVQEALAQTKFFSFLLRINQDKTRYEAVLMPPEEELSYPMFINVMDFKHQALKKIEGEIVTIAPPSPPSQAPRYQQGRNWRYSIYLVVLALLSAYGFRRFRRKRRKLQTNPKSQITNYKQIANPNV